MHMALIKEIKVWSTHESLWYDVSIKSPIMERAYELRFISNAKRRLSQS